ncbi:hypothetical protein R1flu_017600 [Riccia fluitans]|uniref:Bifunctional inhibitor/plant lipid transfer protein/seed storage helical domain-containing protein n=1 Tax=Riccia fluitans TaxID=41844 RepID=A0ABD1ZDE8_9MARC
MARGMGALLVLSVIFVLSGSGEAQSPATSDCTPSLVKLAPCLQFVQGKQDLPPDTCCTALGSIVASAPACLCILIGYGDSKQSFPVPQGFNQTLAKELPGLCKVSANEEKCPALVGGAPMASPPVAMGPAPPPTAGGPSTNKGSSLVFSLTLLVSCIAAALFHSFF